MIKVAVSACLVGKNTKYDGGNNYNVCVMEYLKDKEYITICPEVEGGLTTPRDPSEIINDKVLSNKGKDVTKNFVDGANSSLNKILKEGIQIVMVKAKSPSCGHKEIYDGTFTSKIVNGNGVFTDLALKHNLTIYTEKDIEQMIKEKASL